MPCWALPKVHIAEGSVADITLFDPEVDWTCGEADLVSRSHNTPFLGNGWLVGLLGVWRDIELRKGAGVGLLGCEEEPADLKNQSLLVGSIAVESRSLHYTRDIRKDENKDTTTCKDHDSRLARANTSVMSFAY